MNGSPPQVSSNPPRAVDTSAGSDFVAVVIVERPLRRHFGQFRRNRYFRLVQGRRHRGEHRTIYVSGLRPRRDLGLKIRNQVGGVGIAVIGSVAQTLKQPLEEKQIAEGKGFVAARWRHVSGGALERGQHFVRRAFKVRIRDRA